MSTTPTGGTGKIDYINGIEYDDNNTGTETLSFIQTEEGKAVPNGSSYLYDYNLSDNLGNVRITFDNGNTGNTIRQLQVGNSFTNANSTVYPRFATKEIDNGDGTVSTSTVGGQTADYKDIMMNTKEDTKMKRIHEIFHTLGFDHPKGTEGSQGIMKYPPEKPTQADINQLGNGSFLPVVNKKKDDQK